MEGPLTSLCEGRVILALHCRNSCHLDRKLGLLRCLYLDGLELLIALSSLGLSL